MLSIRSPKEFKENMKKSKGICEYESEKLKLLKKNFKKMKDLAFAYWFV